MAVIPHVRTETRWAAIQRDLADQSALHQHAQAIVHRGERNLRDPLLGAFEYFVRGWMIVTCRNDVKDLLALLRGAKSARLEGMLEAFGQRMDIGLCYETKNNGSAKNDKWTIQAMSKYQV